MFMRTLQMMLCSFEKQAKAIKKKGEKQDKAIEEHEKLLIKSSSEKESITYLRQKKF